MNLVGPDGISPLKQAESIAEAPPLFTVSTLYHQSSGLGTVKMTHVDSKQAIGMTPLEARKLGLLLLQMAERAIGNAITMRILSEPSMGGMLMDQATEAVQLFGEGTRQAHLNAEAELAETRLKANAASAANPGSATQQ